MRKPFVAIREWLVVCVGGFTLAFTAWGLAGVQLWSLHTLLVGGLLTFILGVVPMPRRFNGRDGQHGNSKNVKRLLNFPVFWLSIAFLSYILIQGLNPAWIQVQDDRVWWIEPVQPIKWLPSGVKARYVDMNAFRVLVSFGATFGLVCGLWVGVRRRISAIILLWVLVSSGVCMAIVAILQKFSGAEAVLWTVPSSNSSFWGTFFYRNEAVAYLTLIIATCGVLYFYHFNKAESRAQSGGPHMLLFLFVAVLYTSIGLALSRGGILFGGVATGVFLIVATIRWFVSSQAYKSIVLIGLTISLLGGGGYTILRYVDIPAIEARFGNIEEKIQEADKDSRVIVTKITWKMAQEKLWFGWGAGSWRYCFPMYQKSYPEIYYNYYNKKRGWLGRKIYHYAHNDIVQFLCEYGIVGCSLLLLIFLYWVWCLWFRVSGNALSALMLQVGMLMGFLHATVDFILQSPVYWLAFNGAICVGVKLLLLNSKRSRV